MAKSDYKDLLDVAREKFIAGNYSAAENFLQQVVLVNSLVPEVYHILGTIYYDRGQFNKAIKHFKRALEIDPNYTDASVGLAIILNDLGKYEEGKEVFETAQRALDKTKKKDKDPFLEDRIAQKHIELADLYFQSKVYHEAFEQYQKAHQITQNRPEIRLKIVDCLIRMSDNSRAIKELKLIISDHPEFSAAHVKLATLYYENRRAIEAIDICERVLLRDPSNSEARRIIDRAQRLETTLT